MAITWLQATLFIDATCDGTRRPTGLCARAGLPGLTGPAAVCTADATQGSWNGTAFCA